MYAKSEDIANSHKKLFSMQMQCFLIQ